MKDRTDIMRMIIVKGGLLGEIAEMYIDDEHKANQFLMECYDDCEVGSGLRKFWGRELINDIIMYNVLFNGKQMIDLM